MNPLLVLAITLVFVRSQQLTDLSTKPNFPPYTINNAKGGFVQPLLNRVVFAESGAGDISAISLLAPSVNSSSFSNIIINADASGMDIIRGDNIYGGDMAVDTQLGTLQFRPYGNDYWQPLGYLTTSQYDNLDVTTLQSYNNYTTHSSGILFSDVFVGLAIAIFQSNPTPPLFETADFSYAKLQVVAVNANNSLTVSWTWYQLGSRKSILGSGWNSPNCVIEGVNGFWYVSEGGSGWVWKVPATAPTPNVTTGAKKLFSVTNPQQLIYDPSAHRIYVASSKSGGTVVSFDLQGNTVTTVVSGLAFPVGLAADSTSQFSYLYISENTATGHIYQFNLQTKDLKILASNVNGPQFLTVDQDFPNLLFFATTSAISQLDISKTPPKLTAVYNLASAREILFVSTARLVITGLSFVDLLDFTAFSNQPLFIGIGLVPVTSIDANGYATVTGANYPINVKDSPFGGGLTLLINHPYARQQGWSGYSISFNGQQISNPFGDYKWGPVGLFDYQFVYTPTSPQYELFGGGWVYPIRSPTDLWMNPFWGAYVDTTSVPTGTVPLVVTFWAGGFFDAFSTSFAINITIDNIWPQVSINQIHYYNHPNSFVNVGACAIVQGASTLFNFDITAEDPDHHLLDYALNAVWGANQGKAVYSASYPPPPPNPAASPPIWNGVTNYVVPQLSAHWNANVTGDSTSTHCAHTFILGAWDRSINGWGYLHYSQYTYSVTFLLG